MHRTTRCTVQATVACVMQIVTSATTSRHAATVGSWTRRPTVADRHAPEDRETP